MMSGFQFGGGTTGSLFSTPTTTPAPTTNVPTTKGFSFGTPGASNFSFGQQATPAAPQTAKPNVTFGVAPVASTIAGFGFNTPAPQTAAPVATATAPAPSLLTTSAATTGFNFGTPVAGGVTLPTQSTLPIQPTLPTQPTLPKTQVAPQVNPTQTAAKTQAPGGLFGGITTATPSGALGPAATPVLNLGAKTTGVPLSQPAGIKLGGINPAAPKQVTTTVTQGASLSTTTSTSASTSAPTSMNYRQLEEAINKWTLELEEQEKIFLEQATQVNAWDRLLIDNGDKITQLNSNVERVKLDQQQLDQELDFILSQQKELEELLVPLEQAVENLPAPLPHQQHADMERQHTYKLAENIDAQLKRMAQDLKEIIEHVNTSNTNQDTMDPVTQVAKILNAHMDSLHWVEQNTVALQKRMEEVARLGDMQRREQGKSQTWIH